MGISRINNNLTAQAQRALNQLIGANLQQSTERLASALRINRAGDDAAGLRVASLLQTQIAGLNEAVQNAQTGVNLVNTAGGGLDAASGILQRIRQLAVQAGNSGVMDQSGLESIQAEIEQNVNEINRIAGTTRFGGINLLGGDFSPTAGVRAGTGVEGVSVESASLSNAQNFLSIRQVQTGSARISAGVDAGPQTINTGIQNARDIAVTEARFFNAAASAPAAPGDALTDLAFNGAALQSGGSVSFRGTLADGATEFSGTFDINPGSDLAGGGGPGTSLADAIQAAIDAAEQGAGVDTAGGTGTGETNVIFNAATGRLEFQNGAESGVSQFSVEFTVQNAAGRTQTASGVTRDATIGGAPSGGQTGNAVTAITGSTFEDGPLEIEVINVVAASRRQVEGTIAFETAGGAPAASADSLVGAVFNGATLAAGDTISLNGTNADGSTFNAEITVSNADLGAGSGDAGTLQDLIDELNARDRSLPAGGIGNQSGFEDATASLDGTGRIQLIDDLARTSQSNFTLVVQDNTPGAGGTFGTIVDAAALVQEGSEERATVSVDGGPGQEVIAGRIATLRGNPVDGRTPEITLRIGTGLSAGTDVVNVTRDEFAGRLNGGPEVRFGAGDQAVRFLSGTGAGETATLNFGAEIRVPGLDSAGSGTVPLSGAGNQLNIQIGANAGQTLGLGLVDLRAGQLGLGPGRSLEDIDVTRPGGAGEALQILDAALAAVGEAQGSLGAASNRLGAAIDSLAVSSENLTASRSLVMDTDFASETSRRIRNELLLRANLAVQSQANNLQGLILTDLLR